VSCLLPWKSITFEYCSYGAQTRIAFPKISQVRAAILSPRCRPGGAGRRRVPDQPGGDLRHQPG
jgi:hypothetical protein